MSLFLLFDGQQQVLQQRYARFSSIESLEIQQT